MSIGKSIRLRGWGVAVGGALLLGLVLACALFDQIPVARIAADVLSGVSPLVVTFSALDSYDTDGTIASYAWDFGDGAVDTGATVVHVFAATTVPEAFTVTLTVTDDGGNTAQATQTIEVRVDGDGGDGGDVGTGLPTARFTADPFIGVRPLIVSFDGRESTPGAGSITAYNWDLGDGGSSTGAQMTHTYIPDLTTVYTVTLLVWNSQSGVDAEQHTVIVIVPEDDPDDDPPIAELTVSDPLLLFESTNPSDIPSLFEVSFDPRGSSADAGHSIEYFAWDFGDGDTQIETSDLEITHIYELIGPSHTYVAKLTVFDSQGFSDTVIVNVTVSDLD